MVKIAEVISKNKSGVRFFGPPGIELSTPGAVKLYQKIAELQLLIELGDDVAQNVQEN